MDNVEVSVVIPTFNNKDTLSRAVESCISQQGVYCEIVIVDDCSVDGTSQLADELASQYPTRVTTVHNQTRMNSFESRRVGLQKSSGRFIVFLDADDELSNLSLSETLKIALGEESDLVVFPILPLYAEGRTPEYGVCQARREMYSASELVLYEGEITRSIFFDQKVVWSLVGKMFDRALLVKAFSMMPILDIFQAEDAYAMFVISTLAKKLVSRSDLPAYRYYMGIGGTAADRLIGAGEYARVCDNVKAADAVYEYLQDYGLMNRYLDEYGTLRKRLCADPATRFPASIYPSERLAAFNEFLDVWPVEEAISALASTHWSAPYDICSALRNHDANRAHDSEVSRIRTVGVIYHSLGIGGIENVIRSECACWKELGFSVVLMIDEGQEVLNPPDGVPIYSLPDCFDSYGDNYYMRAAALRGGIATFGIDAVVHHQWLGLTLPWDLLLAHSMGVRCITQVHGAWFSAIGYELSDLLRLPLSYAINDCVVCLSEIDREFWESFNSRVYVINNPTNPKFFQVTPHCHSKKTVAWCGRLDTDKGVLDAIIAIREVKQIIPEAIFKFYGPYSEKIEYDIKALLDGMGLSDHTVQLCGTMTDDELVKEYETVDVYMLSSLMEGWSLSLAEAKAAGLPCVTYDLPYLTLCKPNTGVLTAKLGDATGLGRQVARLLLDDDLRKTTGLAAKKHACELKQISQASFWAHVFEDISFHGAVNMTPEIYDRKAIMWGSVYDILERKLNDKHLVENELHRLRNENEELTSKINRIYQSLPVKIYRRIARLIRRFRLALKAA